MVRPTGFQRGHTKNSISCDSSVCQRPLVEQSLGFKGVRCAGCWFPVVQMLMYGGSQPGQNVMSAFGTGKNVPLVHGRREGRT